MADFKVTPIDFSPLGELPEIFYKGQQRAQEQRFQQLLQGGLPRGAGGAIDWAAAADLAARAGNLGGVESFSRLRNAEAARGDAASRLAETVRHNRAIEGVARRPQIFGNAESGYYTIDPSGAVTPAAAPQQSLPTASSSAPWADPGAGSVLPSEPAGEPQLVPGATTATLPRADPAGAAGAPADRAEPPAPQLAPGVRQLVPPRGQSDFAPEARDLIARQLINGDISGLANLGRGAQGDKRILAVRNRAAEILINERGMSPEDAASHLGAQQQKFKAATIGQNTWARTSASREANLDIILKATEAAVPAALEASEKVGRTRWVPLNRIIQKGQVMTSHPELAKFGMANLQLAEHWARAMNPTGVMRESDRDLALQFLGTATSPSTYRQQVNQLKLQIEREKAAVRGGHTVSSVPGSTREIPKQAISDLMANPGTAALFNEEFGPGQAERILGAVGGAR